MAQVRGKQKGSLASLYEDNKNILFVLVGLYAFVRYLLPSIKPVTDAITQKASDAAAKVVNPVLKDATPAQIAQLKADAKSLAQAFGTSKEQRGLFSGDVLAWFSEDELGAWNVLKNYKKYMADGKTLKKAQYRVEALYPFYSEITENASLKTDASRYMDESEWKQRLAEVF